MSRALWYVSLSAFAVATFLFLILSCVSAPPNPYDPSNTKAYLTLESSSGLISADTVTDTVGNTIRVGITSNLPSDVDSIEISVYNSADGNTDIDTMLKKMTPLLNQDTIWFKTAFTTSGKKTLTALVFAQGNNKNSTTAYISILDRPVKPAARAWPHISVSGTKNIATAQTCSLAVSVLDNNPAQAHTFYVKQDTQPQSEFTPPMFRWTPPAGFTGTSTVIFKVTDTDSPAYFDTATIIITVSAMIAGPKWTKDTVSLTQPAGSIISLTLGDICSGDSLSFSLAAQPVLDGDTIIAGVYSYTFAQGDTNTYWPKIIAKDKNGNADTMTLKIWATKPSASSAKALTAFSFTSPAVTGTIIDSLKTVALTAPYGTDVTALVATFATTGASVKIGTTIQTSGTTANNFTSPVTYTVVAADGSTQAYVVTVTVAASSAKALTAFSFTSPAVTGTITESAKTVALTVPYGTDVTALVATFTSTGASVKIGTTIQTSGTTANNFTSPVTYTVIAADGSTQAYVVTVTVAANTAKALTSFSFAGLGVNGTITESAKTVALTVPYGTDVTALVATFTSTGASVKVGATVQTSATTANNFTNPVTYTVVAADGSTQNYLVTVTIAANTAKALTAFSFAGLGVNGTITESAKTVALTVPYGTDVTALVATFTSTGASVKIGTTVQTSATTANNFTNPVTYTVVAVDGSTQNYVVTVTIAASTAITITTQPQSQAKCLGAPVSFSTVATTSSGSLSYQWKNAAGNLTEGHYVGTATASLSIGAVTATDTGTYSCLVTSTSGTKVTSAGAILTVNTSSTAPSAVNATPSSVCSGNSSTLSLTGGTLGAGAVWKWYADTTAAALSTTGSPISVSPAAATTYYVRAEGTCGNTTFKNVKVTILPSLTVNAISFGTNPACAGSTASEAIAISITGGSNPHYQWTLPASSTRQNPGDVASFSLTNVVGTDGGLYKCVVTDDCNSGSAATTKTNTLAVNSPSSTITLAATTPSSICPPGSVTFNITGTLGTGANWSVYGGGTKLATQPVITNNSFTISGINAATSYVVKAEGGSCDNATAPPASAPVSISISSVNVTFNSNGGSLTPSTQAIACGGTATAPTTAPSKTGYTFGGWYLDTSTSTAFNFTTPITASITLNAKWALNAYQLAVVAGTGGIITMPSPSTVMVNYGAVTTITAAPIGAGYTFVNWTMTSGTATITTSTSLSTFVTLTSGNATVTANFAPVYQVTYNGNGSQIGTAPTDTNHYKAGTNVSVLNGSNGLSKNGYVFVGWKGGPADTNTKIFTMPANNVTLNAQWDVRDTDGNHYDTIVLGGQTWMKQNLMTTKYNTGASIPHVNGSTDWSTLSTPAYCWYNDSINYRNNYGALYNFYVVNTNILAPKGWHVPTQDECVTLNNYLVTNGNIISNFATFFGGYQNGSGFWGLDQFGYWWSSSTLNGEGLYFTTYYTQSIAIASGDFTRGNSVRCLRGDP